jgi:hypothetical protein
LCGLHPAQTPPLSFFGEIQSKSRFEAWLAVAALLSSKNSAAIEIKTHFPLRGSGKTENLRRNFYCSINGVLEMCRDGRFAKAAL